MDEYLEAGMNGSRYMGVYAMEGLDLSLLANPDNFADPVGIGADLGETVDEQLFRAGLVEAVSREQYRL